MWNEESESVDHEGVVGHGGDCLGGRPAGGLFNCLISEQAKSLVALQELQQEVGALLEFRDLVMDTFPNLRSKLHQQQHAHSTPATMTGAQMTVHHHHHHSNIPISIRPGDWTPGVRVKKKLGVSGGGGGGKEKKSVGGDSGGNASSTTSAVQDSGFSTEASSKETHSASSTVPPTSTSAIGTSETDETEDELWSLLDIIHRKGTRLKDEVEALQSTIRDRTQFEGVSNGNFHRELFHSSMDDLRQLRQERDLLLDRLAEMEAEVIAGRFHASRLQEDLENLLSAKHDLEEQLKAIVSQRGEVNSRIHDLHLQFVAKSVSDEKLKLLHSSQANIAVASSVPSADGGLGGGTTDSSSGSDLDSVLGDRIPRIAEPDGRKIAAILKESNPVVLQKHLLVSTVQNQVLKKRLDDAGGLELGLRAKLDKAVEENEDLRFELQNKTIELEGTKARARLLESVQKSPSSPDIIPEVDQTPPHRTPSRTEISTASMKAMIPLQMDHSSSTESAHDQMEINRVKEGQKRRPSKIPLKSYTAPKPPGGKQHTRSRSGESHSWRGGGNSAPNSNSGNSLKNNSLSKSRNSSLVSARDSLSGKLRNSESLSQQQHQPQYQSNNTLKKWTAKEEKLPKNSISANAKSPSRWILSSYKNEEYPDSLMDKSTPSLRTIENPFFCENGKTERTDFYDSIDSNMASSSCYCRSHGEDLAECDSLEKELMANLSFSNNK